MHLTIANIENREITDRIIKELPLNISQEMLDKCYFGGKLIKSFPLFEQFKFWQKHKDYLIKNRNVILWDFNKQ